MNLRYGILSTSSIAPRFIAGVRAAGAGEIVALSSRTLEKAQEKAALWNIPVAYGSHEELLEKKGVYYGLYQNQFAGFAAPEGSQEVVCFTSHHN